ncbi:MAG TPA: hypothetical protein VIL31_08515 [Cyclobacteriaceae bacterium]|jgi:hypothetical protein
MTVRSHSVRRISGIALLALFLTFVSVQVFPDTRERSDDNPCDESQLNDSSGPAVPLVLRNNPKSGLTGGFLYKAVAGVLPSAPGGKSLIASTLRMATRQAIPQLVSNPFYVVLTAKAP